MADSNAKYENQATRIVRAPAKSGSPDPVSSIAQFLVVVEGSELGRFIEITQSLTRIGRGKDNDFVLHDPCISTHHCIIHYRDGEIQVQDSASTNGTFLDDQIVTGSVTWPLAGTLRIGGQIVKIEYRQRQQMHREKALSEELLMATRYVQSLLPLPLTQNGVLEMNWQFVPSSSLGGDIFDYFWLDTEHFAMYLLDVCGHGTGPALHSVSIFNLLRQRSLPETNFLHPQQVLQALNQSMPMERYGDMYFTMWYGVYCTVDRSLRFSSAGHPPALLFDVEGNLQHRLETLNPAIGFMADLEYMETAILLPPGSQIYLYSDGVYEFTCESGEMWGHDEFVRLLEDQLPLDHGLPEILYQQVRRLARGHQVEDDFSLIRFSTNQ